MIAERDESKEVDPRLAWAIVFGFVSFFVGMAVFANASRLLGGILMGVPLAIAALSIIRTPHEEWSRLAHEVKRRERLREGRPRTGMLWWAFHRLGDLAGVIALVVFIVVVVYTIVS